MTDKIKIYLPTTTEAEKIHHLIYKVTDVFYWKESINSIKINENLPCSNDNPWEFLFSYKDGNIITGRKFEKEIVFIDQADNKYKINYYLNESEQPHKGVVLILDSSACLAAIGKKIVDFFSGEMFLATRKGMRIEEEKEALHSAHIASFGLSHPFNHNCSYQNALNYVKPLSADELLEMKKNNIWAETDYSLINALDSKYSKAYIEMEELNDTLHHNKEIITKKLKV
jgi:hypothetical protein